MELDGSSRKVGWSKNGARMEDKDDFFFIIKFRI